MTYDFDHRIKMLSFDPEVIGAVREAFVAALNEFQDTDLIREVIGERIIAAATAGERDPVRLRAAAFAGLLRDEDWP
jgi:hypothetical protein